MTTQVSNQIANITSKPQNLTASQITLVTAIVEQVAEKAAVNQEVNIVTCQWVMTLSHIQVRDNYLQTINNIQQADADVIYESQLAMNSSTRYVASNILLWVVYSCKPYKRCWLPLCILWQSFSYPIFWLFSLPCMYNYVLSWNPLLVRNYYAVIFARICLRW